LDCDVSGIEIQAETSGLENMLKIMKTVPKDLSGKKCMEFLL
jgi:hypothetical protein